MSSRNLPHHLYVYVDSSLFRVGKQRFEPTNMVLFEERSFTRDTGWPTDIRTATKIWECEGGAT